MSAGGGNEELGGGWRALDQQVRRLARRRAALDVEEARLLIAARAAEVHLHLGLGSFDEYLERVLGYAPTTARDRMRVAMALEELPRIRRALQKGDLSFSAVREITRVAVPETEQIWLDAIADCNVREIEDSVRGRRRGDRPTDRPRLDDRVIRMELPPEVYALFIEARRHLEKIAGEAMTDAAFLSEVCRQALAGEPAPRGSNQPPHQVALTVCVDCKRGWQDAGGRPVEVSAAAIERARCDAVELGRVDGAVAAKPTRSIPPRTRRMVLARDHHRCTVPGCRSSRFVDVHHIQWRSRRGDDEPRNLTTLCDASRGGPRRQAPARWHRGHAQRAPYRRPAVWRATAGAGHAAAEHVRRGADGADGPRIPGRRSQRRGRQRHRPRGRPGLPGRPGPGGATRMPSPTWVSQASAALAQRVPSDRT